MLSYSAEINDGEYSDILSLLPDNCIIQKPVTNEKSVENYKRSNGLWSQIILPKILIQEMSLF